jgi:peptidoglycan lytic transglycosylase D
MTSSHRPSALIFAASLLTLVLSACVSSRPQAFKLAFLPSTPLQIDPVIVEPPPVDSKFFAKESPNLVDQTLSTPARPPEVESRMVRAQDHFDAGKRLYQVGDMPAARDEFDRAIDLLLSAPENMPDRQRLEKKLDQMVDSIYRYDLDGLGGGVSQQAVVYDQSPLDSILDMTFPTDPNLRPKVREELEATVSQLPLEENDAVLGYIHYFSTDRGHKVLSAGLQRAGRYRPLIQRILDEEGVPQELIYLAQIESGFLPRARSNKKAVGMWQFVQFRGQEYGLNQTASTDDRMDPEKATRAAAKHLHDLYATFGDWYLAMAAYNCGPGCVDHAVQRTGYADYWELVRRNALPHETNNYVPVVLAITIMAKNPKDYELLNLDLDQPVEYDTINMESPTSLALITDAIDRPVPDVQDLNPALLKPVAPVGYQLHVPKGSSDLVRMALDEIPAEHRAAWRIHHVGPDETLAEISHRFGTPVASITAANQRPVDHPEVGDSLIIPVSYSAVRPAVRSNRTAIAHPPAHRAAASKKTPATAPVRKAVAAPVQKAAAPAQKASPVPVHKAAATSPNKTGIVKTASVTAKRASTVN